MVEEVVAKVEKVDGGIERIEVLGYVFFAYTCRCGKKLKGWTLGELRAHIEEHQRRCTRLLLRTGEGGERSSGRA